MLNNDVLRRLRYMLDLKPAQLVEIFNLADYPQEPARLRQLLRKDDHPEFLACDDATLGYFLNGLIAYRRGKDPARPLAPPELPLSNNAILKSLRVAFALKDQDVQALLAESDLKLSTTEISALFRQRDHRNYRPCGDQLLRRFLRSLSLRLRPRELPANTAGAPQSEAPKPNAEP